MAIEAGSMAEVKRHADAVAESSHLIHKLETEKEGVGETSHRFLKLQNPSPVTGRDQMELGIPSFN